MDTTGASRQARWRERHKSRIAELEAEAAALRNVGSSPLDRADSEELIRMRAENAALTAKVSELERRLGRGDLTEKEMAPTMRQRYEAALRSARKGIREELKVEVANEIRGTYDAYITYYNNEITTAKDIIASYKGVMSGAEFRKIKACLHPDHNTFHYAAEALQVFTNLEKTLVKQDEIATDASLPSSAIDLLARRKQWRRQAGPQHERNTHQTHIVDGETA
jgi:hypothetical protein